MDAVGPDDNPLGPRAAAFDRPKRGGVENGCRGGKRVREVGIFRVQDV